MGPLLRVPGEGRLVPGRHLDGQHVEPHAAEAAHGSGEAGVDYLGAEADRLEDLGAGVGGHRGDAHLGHHLQDALVTGGDVAATGLVRGQVRGEPVQAVGQHPVDRLEGHVRADGRGAVAQQQGDVVHLACVAALDEQAHARPGLLADQVVVDGTHRQQRRDRRLLGGDAPVAQDQQGHAVGDRRRGLAAQVLEGVRQALPAVGDPVAGLQDGGAESLGPTTPVHVDEAGQLLLGEDRVRQVDLSATVRRGIEQVALRTYRAADGRDQFLADGVEGRVRDLGEELREVVVQLSGTIREGRHGGVGAHGPDRLLGVPDHGGGQQLEFLVRVAEDLLALQRRALLADVALPDGEVVEVEQVVLQPLGVGLGGGQFGLDLVVAHDPALGGVDEEHATRLEAALLDHARGGHVDHAHLAGHHDQIVVGDPVAAGPEAVAVEDGADDGAVGEGDGGRPVPGLHQRGVVLVEGPTLGFHRLVVLPRFGDHHQDGLGQRVAAEAQQFERLVEGGGVAGAGRADREDAVEVAG